MAREQWDVATTAGCCSLTGRKIEEGEEFYTVLFEEGDSFRRADYCLEAWKSPPEDAFCHFRTRIPVKEKRKQLLLNNDVLAGFFVRLADESEPVRVQFRFVLALILMRKRKLRYERSLMEDEAEVWEMTLVNDQSKHRVINPRMTDDQIEGASAQLSAILHQDMGEWASTDTDRENTSQSDEQRHDSPE